MSTTMAPTRRTRRRPADHDSRARRLRRCRVRRRQGARRSGLRADRARHLPHLRRRSRRASRRWNVYAFSLLAFSLVSVLVLYAAAARPGCAAARPRPTPTAVPPRSRSTPRSSFVTNTNWQNYGGELTMSHLTQMAGLAVQNFVSAAVGLAVAVALIRGLVRRRTHTIGNFWVDLTRGTIRVLLPLAIVFAIVLASQGVVQNFHGFTHAHDRAGRRPRRFRAARSRARRRSRRSARTAAGPTTPTPPTRSRTRTASRTCSRSSSC